MAPKLTATELDAMADYWSRYFQAVIDINRQRRSEEDQARLTEFEAKREENEAELQRRRQQRWERERAIMRAAAGRK